MTKHKLNSGFTIAELLIVIVVIGILAAITIVAYNGISGRAKETTIISSATQAGKKILGYSPLNSDTLPVALVDANIQNVNGATYQYTRNTASTPNSFCITVSQGGLDYSIAGTNVTLNTPTKGPCPGHTGTIPTTLADGSSCPTNFVLVPGSSAYNTQAFCVMKYEAKNVSGVATSQAAGTPWVSVTQAAAMTAAAGACSGCHLLTEPEWLTLAQNVISVPSNWSGGTIGSGSLYIGHTDNSPTTLQAADPSDANGYANTGNVSGNQRRTLTLTNGNVIWDMVGNAWEWTNAQITGGQPGSATATFREWNALAAPGSISPNPYPAYANALAATWTATQNIGMVVSDSTDTTTRGFIRGGYVDDVAYAGPFRLTLNYAPTLSSTLVGFRAAK